MHMSIIKSRLAQQNYLAHKLKIHLLLVPKLEFAQQNDKIGQKMAS